MYEKFYKIKYLLYIYMKYLYKKKEPKRTKRIRRKRRIMSRKNLKGGFTTTFISFIDGKVYERKSYQLNQTPSPYGSLYGSNETLFVDNTLYRVKTNSSLFKKYGSLKFIDALPYDWQAPDDGWFKYQKTFIDGRPI